MFPGRRDNRAGLGVALLLYQILSANNQLPPVTLVTIVAQIAIFLGLVPNLCQLCQSPLGSPEWGVSASAVASFVHHDDWHLYYNLISFMWKGRRLERHFGSVYFAYLLAIFSVLTNVVLVGLSYGLTELFQLDQLNLMRQCAVGFSGVIFALKVVVNHHFPTGDSLVMGMFPIPSRLACWAELILIQLLVPNASFLGHLAGILVGCAYVSGPLRWLMDLPFSLPHSGGPAEGTSAFGGSGRYARSSDWSATESHRDYTMYTGGLSEEEQFERALRESRLHNLPRRPTAPPPP